ncbi:MAG: lipid II:glycine glycyltransferase FemX [Limisphaerales bacterium]
MPAPRNADTLTRPTVPSTASAESSVEIVDPLEFPGWDDSLATHPQATIFHTAAWARALVSTYGFKARYQVQRKDRGLTALLPLMESGSRWRGRRLISLPFTDACPPLLGPEVSGSVSSRVSGFSTTPEGSLARIAASEPLLAAALRTAEATRCQFIELRDCEVWTRGIPASVAFLGHSIPLHASEEPQLQLCSPSMRRALRKANRGPLRLKEGRDWADVQAYYSLHCLTRQRHGLPPQPIGFFRNIHRHLVQKGLGFVILALDEGLPIAGAVFFGFGRTALYKFGASADTHLELRPNNLVLWQGIRRCAELGFSALDLGRTSLDNEGLRRFKLGLGGEERLIQYVRQDVRSGCIVATPDRAQGWHNRVFRRLPRPISRALGAVMYRFVS